VNITRYEIMGVLPNQPKEVVVNAYKRQWEMIPDKRKALIDALMSIGNDLNDEQLNEYAVTQSSIFESQVQSQTNGDDGGLTNQALLFFELQPLNDYKAQSIVQAFRRKVAQDPSCANTARNMLMLISQASTDDNYTAELVMEYGEGFSLPTAKEILGLSDASGFGPDTLDDVKEKVRNMRLLLLLLLSLEHGSNQAYRFETPKTRTLRQLTWRPWRRSPSTRIQQVSKAQLAN
jgi:ubiquitin carboxyl-terminal hydrolase 25/28